ncbi:hypothetical protein AMAG_19668 [Allomyces macrogynus ATCC 38327]|uniref:Uncharacterized protein n=1 Tax=Allomyces macrogynus (strain ATCC 38327) TaxID=578462 RepID=A0A0L0SXL4_ALLM3|nr:hypothetical protein AMAG_19668 [Allomyces macrogynus ATCC 38327]|eukprot:KNE67231.1 hypothetical protein AMAG_19668 [Allomyces macrogynus ATCC 38327]
MDALAKAYYDRLFKEYCLGNLSRCKTGQVALQWRTHREVVAGKGQWECGHLACCERSGLKSWEVLFGYNEQGEKKRSSSCACVLTARASTPRGTRSVISSGAGVSETRTMMVSRLCN